MADKLSPRGLASRAVNVGGALVEAHLVVARREAREDGARVTLGLALVFTAVVAMVFTALLLETAAVVAAVEIGRLHPLYAILAVAGGNALIALSSVLIARSQLARPVMVETRALVQKTVKALLDG